MTQLTDANGKPISDDKDPVQEAGKKFKNDINARTNLQVGQWLADLPRQGQVSHLLYLMRDPQVANYIKQIAGELLLEVAQHKDADQAEDTPPADDSHEDATDVVVPLDDKPLDVKTDTEQSDGQDA